MWPGGVAGGSLAGQEGWGSAHSAVHRHSLGASWLQLGAEGHQHSKQVGAVLDFPPSCNEKFFSAAGLMRLTQGNSLFRFVHQGSHW